MTSGRDGRTLELGKGRMDDSTANSPNRRPTERTKRLAAYIDERGEDGLEECARLLFPEWFVVRSADGKGASNSIELPMEAPERYQGLSGPETPPEFVQRVYGRWLGHGLTRAHIGKLDAKLSDAIYNWLSRPNNVWPPGVDLPTKSEQISRDLDALRAHAPNGQLALALAGLTAREAGRIRSAIQRRRK